LGIDPARPVVLFVGRVTRQKGIHLLLRAARLLPAEVQVVLRAGSPDTPELRQEVDTAVAEVRALGHDVVFVEESLSRKDLTTLIGSATVFCCPSVYEPFGLVNVEAMACGVPVVASAVGGIPEIVVPDETGVLVPFEPEGGGSPEPRDPESFSRALADAVNALMADPERRVAMGRAARARVLARFSWASIAEQTLAFYRELAAHPPREAR
jgi:glycosyltransferase involved in cell wall biosynthesis